MCHRIRTDEWVVRKMKKSGCTKTEIERHLEIRVQSEQRLMMAGCTRDQIELHLAQLQDVEQSRAKARREANKKRIVHFVSNVTVPA